MRKRWLILGAVLVLGAGFLLVSLLVPSDRARIVGTVTLPSGAPAAGYTVVAELRPVGGSGTVRGFPILYPVRWTTTTDREGRYELTGIRTDGEVWVSVVVPGLGFGGWQVPDRLGPGDEARVDMVTAEFVSRPR